MKWWIALAMVISIAGSAEAGGTAFGAAIGLRIENDARVPPDVLERALAEIERIFDEADVAVRWTDTAADITVRIVPQVLGYGRRHSTVMGVARPTEDGPTIDIFLTQVREFARMHRAGLSTMLAHVIAHELGHVLLGTSGHSPTGVMQAAWSERVVREAVRGSLTFTPAQAAAIQASR